MFSEPGVEPARLSRCMMDVRRSRRVLCLRTPSTGCSWAWRRTAVDRLSSMPIMSCRAFTPAYSVCAEARHSAFLLFHADAIYVFDTWLLPKGPGPAAPPGVPQHGLRSELAGLPTVASSMTDAWIIRWFKRPSLLFHSRRYLRRTPQSRIRTAWRGSLAA